MTNLMIQNASLDELVSEIKLLVREMLQSRDLSESKQSNTLLTRNEASKLLNVSKTTLSNWNKLGVLPAFAVGNRVYYKLEDVEKSLKRVA